MIIDAVSSSPVSVVSFAKCLRISSASSIVIVPLSVISPNIRQFAVTVTLPAGIVKLVCALLAAVRVVFAEFTVQPVKKGPLRLPAVMLTVAFAA